jgi:hypothetical protein
MAGSLGFESLCLPAFATNANKAFSHTKVAQSCFFLARSSL